MSKLLKFRPPRIAMVYLAIAVGLHVLSPQDIPLPLPFRLLGILSLVTGFALMMWAWSLFNVRKTPVCATGEASAFIQKAPYSFTRNPMYLGMVSMLCGVALLLGSVIAFLAPLAFFITINNAFIPFEEQNMERIFSDQYELYRERVRRWL